MVMSKRKYDKFDTYIERVLKHLYPELGMTSEAKMEVNNLIKASFQKIMDAVNYLNAQSDKKTISAKHLGITTDIVLGKELAKHVHQEGTRAVTEYNTSVSSSQGKSDTTTTRSERAKLIFPVGRIENTWIRPAMCGRDTRLSEDAPVYMAAVLEYITADILELAGHVAKDDKKMRITTRHLALALQRDDELDHFLGDYIVSGGVVPHIHSALLLKKKTRKKKTDA